MGFGGGDANLYAYVGNDPINATDPSGQFIELAGQCLVGAAINVGLGYATSDLAGRKYTAGDAARDGAIGCALGVVDPVAEVGEAGELAADVVSDQGAAIAGDAGSAIAEGGGAAAAGVGESAVADTAGDAAAGTCSFSGDTAVSTPSGETAIDQLQPGDDVEAYDPTTGQTGPHAVTSVWTHTDQLVEDVTIDGETIETTPEHPFDLDGVGFVPTGALWVGAMVRLEDGRTGVVQHVTFNKHAEVMYNLTVETAHTFFVGQQQVLVHNTCVPQKARDVLNHIDNTGSRPQGYIGDRQFLNDGRGGGQILSRTNGAGQQITYREYDVNPYTGANRGPERLVVGSDGSAYYTNDHYMTFESIR